MINTEMPHGINGEKKGRVVQWEVIDLERYPLIDLKVEQLLYVVSY